MSFTCAKPRKRGAAASVSVLSRGRTAVQLNITFDRTIADHLRVGLGDRVACAVGESKDAGKFALIKNADGCIVRACGSEKFIVRTACTGNRLLPHSARPFYVSHFDKHEPLVVLREA